MTKEKIINILKKSVYYIAMAVLLALLVSSTIITIGVTVKAVDIAYDNGGNFADLVDRLADTLADTFSDDNNYSKATKGIVANAQFEASGETYVDIPIDSYNLVHTESGYLGADTFNYIYLEFISFVPKNQVLYFLTLTYSYEHDYTMYSYFYPINSYDTVYFPNGDIDCQCVGGSAFVPLEKLGLDYPSYPYNIVYDYLNESFWLILQDNIGSFPGGATEFTINIYEVPTTNNESTTTESLTDILGNSINFSTSAITTSVKEVFEGLFVNENNTISNYATYVVWFSGIAIALGFFKYILRFILTMGDKK